MKPYRIIRTIQIDAKRPWHWHGLIGRVRVCASKPTGPAALRLLLLLTPPLVSLCAIEPSNHVVSPAETRRTIHESVHAVASSEGPPRGRFARADAHSTASPQKRGPRAGHEHVAYSARMQPRRRRGRAVAAQRRLRVRWWRRASGAVRGRPDTAHSRQRAQAAGRRAGLSCRGYCRS